MVGREYETLRLGHAMNAEQTVQLLDRCDAWRRPERFELTLQTCECMARAQHRNSKRSQAAAFAQWRVARSRAAAVDAGAAATRAATLGLRGPAIAAAVHDARVLAVAEDLNDEIND